MRATLALLSAGLLAPLALAQSAGDEGCERTNPCPWVVDVDDKGFQFYVADEQTFSRGDWYELLVFNDDLNRSHTITLTGHEVSVTVPADGMSQDTGAFQFSELGTFELRDAPTGDKITVHVVEGDALSGTGSDSPSDEDGEGAPGLPLALLAVALVGSVLLRRRE